MPSKRAFAAALTVVLLTASPAVAAVPDPADAGPLTTNRVDYQDGVELVGEPTGTKYPEDVRGSVHFPVGTSGPLPVILFLHGRHSTCSAMNVETLGSPCPGTPFTNSIDSYMGYDYIADNLASHGYVVMSVNANGTNTYDTSNLDSGANARSQILAFSLDRLAAWNEEAGPGAIDTTLIGKIDLTRIGMMGHSRGGEGVTDFIAYNRTRTDGPRYPGLKAVFALAPIDAKAQRPTGVAWSTLLPYCDGDVTPLNGSRPFERSKFDDADTPRIQWGVNGTNHNFFNTIWTNDDNSTTTDDACASGKPGSLRLSKDDEKRVGLGLMAAFLRRYVGPELAFDPLMTGEAPLPASACPGGIAPCDNLVQTSYVGGSSQRRLLLEPGATDTLTRASGGGAITPSGLATFSTCTPTTAGTGCPTPRNRSLTRQLTVAWDGPSSLRLALGGADADAMGFRALTLRAAADYGDIGRNPQGVTQDFDVTLIDTAGARASVPAAEFANGGLIPSAGTPVDPPGGSADQRENVLAGIRIPLERFTGINLGSLAAVEMGFGTRTARGSIQLADVMLQEPATHTTGPGSGSGSDGVGTGSDGVGSGTGTGGGGGTGSGPSSTCTDRVRPRSHFRRGGGVSVARTRLVIRGTARDRGCRPGGSGLRHVRVAVLKRAPGRRCRYILASGRLGGARSCKRPVFLYAKGTARWRLAVTARPPRGHYSILVRARDRAGNRERPSAHRLLRVK